MMRAPRGMVLLEVMLGIAILGMAGVALITLLTQTVATVQRGRTTERKVASASQLLDRASLWSAAELTVHLGRTRVAGWDVQVDALGRRLYDVSILDTLSETPVLRTTFYRPAPQHDE
jgi:type II secretory pathway pseudopilin PulG